MTNRLDGLEEEGLITRSPDPSDRRGILIELTDLGKKKIDEAVAIQADKEAVLLNSLTKKDKDALNDALRKAVLAIGEPLTPKFKREG
jgi:DNA-binding MarR family transcriptional regulator